MNTPFVDFSDTVSAEYGIAGLCGLVYSLELAADATLYGTSLVAGPPPSIDVYTNDIALKGTQVALTINVVATPLQDTPFSPGLPFNVVIQDTCTIAVLSFTTAPAAMTQTVTLPAITQSTVATDDLSTTTAIANACGLYHFEILDPALYPFVTVDPTTGVISVQTNDMTFAGQSFIISLQVTLVDYPAVTAAVATF